AQRCKEHRMAVTRDDLSRDRLWRQAKLVCDIFFNVRVDVGKGANSAADCAGGDFRAGCDQAGAAAVKFSIGLGKLQTEGYWFCVNAVAAADGWRKLVLFCALLQRSQKGIKISKQNVRRAGKLYRKGGVQHVR